MVEQHDELVKSKDRLLHNDIGLRDRDGNRTEL